MSRRLLPTVFATALSLPMLAGPALGQAAGDFHWDKALAAGSQVSINNVNGDIKVTPSTTGKVDIVGIKHGSGSELDHIKAEVIESSHGISVCVIHDDDDSSCDDSGRHSRNHGDRNWDRGRIDLEVAVPANVVVSAGSVSGDIDITGAHGDIDVNSVSGDVHMSHLHANGISARSVSGDVQVGVDELSEHGDLEFTTVSGDVTLDLPKALNADLSMTTVSGDIDSDFPLTLGNGRMSRRGVNARIGSGGRRLDVRTVSGDLRLRAPK